MRKTAYLVLTIAIAGAIIQAACVPESAQREVRGVVRNEEGPLAGAVVRLRGASQFAVTNPNGEFALTVDAETHDAQLTAWAPGFFVGGSEGTILAGPVELSLHRHPTTDHADYPFISPVLDLDNPTACSHCHSDRYSEMQGAMPVEEWLQDAHATAAVNPRFLSLYNGTAIDGAASQPTLYRFDAEAGINIPVSPSLALDAVGPGYRLDYPAQTGTCATCHVPVAALAAPYTADSSLVTGIAQEGITCDFCHKIQDVRLRPDGLPDPGLPGVLSIDLLRPAEDEQVFIGPLDDTPGEDIYSALYNESAYCAPCHTGQFWDVSIYNSFGEWLASPYSDPQDGKTCQDCHMPPVGVTTFVQLSPEDSQVVPLRDPETIFSHRMPGAADQALLEATATLEVDAQRTGNHLQVTVRVTNSGAGHHIPTDNPLRNMFLLVQATDSAGQALPLIDGPTIPSWGGVGDPADGYYAGLPGVLYAKILADFYTGETPTYAYWRQTRLVSDNRIPALATDETVYEFALPSGSDSVTVNAQLYLRRAFIELMDLKGWAMPDRLMEQTTVSVP
jgi:hypothetical protein